MSEVEHLVEHEQGRESLPFPVLPGYRPMDCLEGLLSGERTTNRTRVLYDTQLLGACLHASESGGRSRPEAVRGMPEVPVAPPATGPNTVRPQSCSMLIIHEKPDSLLEGRCFQSRSRCRNVRPASIGLPGSAQQRTPRTEETKRSHARSVVLFQLLDVGLQFLPASQATKVELNHLQSPLRWLFSCPEADQQAGDDPQVDLDLNPIHVVGEQMTAAQDAFEPAEKQLDRPSIFVAQGHQVRRQVQEIRDQDQNIRLAVGVEFVSLDLDDPHLLLDDVLVVIGAQAFHNDIADNARCLCLLRERSVLEHFVGDAVLDACDEGGTGVQDVLEKLVFLVATIDNIHPTGLEHLSQLLAFGAAAMREGDVLRNALEYVEVDMHFGGPMVIVPPQSPDHLGQSRQQAAVHSDQALESLRILAARGRQKLLGQLRNEFTEQFGVKDPRGFTERAQAGPRTAEVFLNLPKLAGLLDAA